MRIREAALDDAAGIAAVHVASWQGAYRGQLPDDVLDGLSVERRTAGWQQLLTDDAWFTLVAEDDQGRVVGFLHGGPARDEDADATTGEVMGIYALPAVWGTGAGRELMAEGVSRLRSAGYRTATLWVLDSNARARRFYERAGWAPDGTTKNDVVAGVRVDEVRYRRGL